MQGKIVDSGKANSYTVWRYVTPKHNFLVETMLQSKCHIIATMRAKMEYAIQQNNVKIEVQKIGMGAIHRDGTEYEFTLFIELSNNDHSAIATKDRTSLFDGMIFNTLLDRDTVEVSEFLSYMSTSEETKSFSEINTRAMLKDLLRKASLVLRKNNIEVRKYATYLVLFSNRQFLLWEKIKHDYKNQTNEMIENFLSRKY